MGHQWVSILLCGLLVWTTDPGAAWSAQSRASSADSTEATRYLLRGTTEEQLGDYEEAISYFEAALERRPGEPALLLALADAHEAKGDLATALFYARQARQQGSSHPHYFRRLAELQRAAGEPAPALRTYSELLDRFPEQRAIHQARAQLLSTLGRPDSALSAYETYLAHTPLPPVSVYRQMLSLYDKTGDRAGLRQTLRTLIERRPNSLPYRRRLAALYADDGRPEAALDLLAPLARQRPDDSQLQRRVERLARAAGSAGLGSAGDAQADTSHNTEASADALVQRARSIYDAEQTAASPDTSRLRAADDLLRRALGQSPAHEEALSLRARLSEQLGHPERAGRLWETLLEAQPQDPRRWVQAASAYQQAHRSRQAASVAEEGLLLFPGHAPLARTAGFARLRSGTPAEATEHFRTALELRTDTSSATQEAVLRAGLGLAYTRLDRPQDAAAAFEAAEKLAPNHPDVLRLHAHGLADQGEQLDLALDLAQRSVEQAPGEARFLHTLGWVQFQRHEPAAARRDLRAALNAGPPSPRLLEHLGEVEQALGNDAAARTYWKRALKLAPERSSLQEKIEASSTT
jgi:tetratricopeptide (TPR) repeat protein